MSTAEFAAATDAPAAVPATLDDMMLAMDVVDTLRHRERLVERELNEEAKEEQLIERLRALYKGQGIEVPDSVIARGVEALKESRFVYTPPKPGFGRALATLWVKRTTYGKWGGATLAALAVAIGLSIHGRSATRAGGRGRTRRAYANAAARSRGGAPGH